MFKSFAADVLGLSDIGTILAVKDFDKADVDDYIFPEDNEKIFVVIKSKTDEYCFTNLAFIHLDGETAVSKKRTLNRYPYSHYPISHVRIETAGTVDLDVEIKFNIGEKALSIDIAKKQMPQVRDLYKALCRAAEKYQDIQKHLTTLQQTHDAINRMFALHALPEQVVLSLPDIICQTSQQVEAHLNSRRHEIQDYDFGPIFARYIKS